MTCSFLGIPGKITEVFFSLIASVMLEPADIKMQNKKRTEAPVLYFPEALFVTVPSVFFRNAKTGIFAGYDGTVFPGRQNGME